MSLVKINKNTYENGLLVKNEDKLGNVTTYKYDKFGQEVEKTLQKMNNGIPVTIFGSGRTDAGVHAIGQVIHFDYPQERPLERMRFALDTQTPEDIAVSSVEVVADDFHARYHVVEKTYRLKFKLLSRGALFGATMLRIIRIL